MRSKVSDHCPTPPPASPSLATRGRFRRRRPTLRRSPPLVAAAAGDRPAAAARGCAEAGVPASPPLSSPLLSAPSLELHARVAHPFLPRRRRSAPVAGDQIRRWGHRIWLAPGRICSRLGGRRRAYPVASVVPAPPPSCLWGGRPSRGRLPVRGAAARACLARWRAALAAAAGACLARRRRLLTRGSALVLGGLWPGGHRRRSAQGPGCASGGCVVAVARPGVVACCACGSSAPPPLVPGRAAVLDVHVLGSAAGPPVGSSALCRSSAFGFREGLGEGESLSLLADQ